jgi:hypothetical protein
VSEPETFVEGGYPAEPYAEVVPGLFQATTQYTPQEMFDLGFDALFDLCGIDRGNGGSDERYVVHPIDDVPTSTTPRRSTTMGSESRSLCGPASGWPSTACQGLTVPGSW